MEKGENEGVGERRRVGGRGGKGEKAKLREKRGTKEPRNACRLQLRDVYSGGDLTRGKAPNRLSRRHQKVDFLKARLGYATTVGGSGRRSRSFACCFSFVVVDAESTFVVFAFSGAGFVLWRC